jgi:hypothetical protein
MMSDVMRKLDADSRFQAGVVAAERGLLDRRAGLSRGPDSSGWLSADMAPAGQ